MLMADDAETAFFRTANAAAVAYAAMPRYATFRIVNDVHAARGTKSYDDRDAARLGRDPGMVVVGSSVVQPSPFPAPPDFDALSRFTIAWYFELAHARPIDDGVSIYNVAPMRYDGPKPTGVTVSVQSLGGYRVAFAPDSAQDGQPIHLVLTRTLFAQDNITDVYVDPQTYLPVRVKLGISTTDQEATIDAAYQIVAGRHVLASFHFHDVDTEYPKLAFDLTSTYSDYAFPAAPPDPLLAPKP